MDYQEAIKEAEIQINMYESMILYNRDFEPKNDNSNYERKIDFLKTIISAMQEMQEYKQKLNNAYGECDDLLRTVVDGLVRHEGIEFGTPIKSRILTDDDVDLWEWYKQLGTLEEVREAVEKQKVVPDINVGEWIPVQERLPEKDEIVLVSQIYSWERFEDCASVTIGRLHPREKNGKPYWEFQYYRPDFKHGTIMDNGIICPGSEYIDAWMPLPKPYRPDFGDE